MTRLHLRPARSTLGSLVSPRNSWNDIHSIDVSPKAVIRMPWMSGYQPIGTDTDEKKR